VSDPLLQIVTRCVFLLVCALTLWSFVRWRDVQHLEVAALFAALTLVIAVQAVGDMLHTKPPDWLVTLSVVFFVAQPYLLLRVLGQFRDVPRHQHVIAVAALALSSSLLLAYASNPPTPAISAIVIAFAYVEAYASIGFIRSAITQRGITQWRLVAIAVGSGCLAAVIVASGAGTAFGELQPLVGPASDLLALCSAMAYYVGMAPPGWLRHVWQGAEVHRFLLGLSGLSGDQRVASTLEYLPSAAARATGGSGAILALGNNEASGIVDLYPGDMAVRRIAVTDSPPLATVYAGSGPLALRPDDSWGSDLRQLASTMHARGLLVAPLRAGEHLYGVFVVFLTRPSIFALDDLAVLSVLADQAALALEGAKLLEESIRERATLAAVMASMHEGLLVMDEEMVVRYCNARAPELFGLSELDLLGTSARTLFSCFKSRLCDEDGVMTRWRRALRDPDQRTTIDLEFKAPPRSVQAEVFTVNDSPRTRRGIGVVLRDVTAERDLVRTKDELVSVVSHELRTPLASVVGFAELLRTRELADAQRQQYLTVILEEGRRLTALINDFLDLQRMESGRQDIVPRSLDLQPLLEQVVTAAGPDPLRPIDVEIPSGLRSVRADPDRVQQVIANLISNARKYSPAGGPIHVSAREADGQVIVSVVDNGLGVPPEAIPRMFEKFFRIDNSDRRAITGTGLGLAICRKIVEAHGGRVWAESDGLGHGSRFSFTLPLATATPATGDVLIVEDDAGFAQLLEAELASRNITGTWVSSAEEALQRLSSGTPKALVLDLVLPGVSGEEVAQALFDQRRADLPIIVVTVKDLDHLERAALARLRVHAILRKEPNVGAVTADLVESIINQRQPEVAA
jgi:signal transduction histidine kinase